MPQAPIQLPASGVHSGAEIGGLASAALYAVATMQSGTTPPTAAGLGLSSLAGIWFHNTLLGVVYVRDQADTTWIAFCQVDETTKVIVLLSGGIPLYGAPAIAGGTADALTAIFHPAPTVLADGGLYPVRAAYANATTTPTINVNGIGAVTICKTGGIALAAGDIRAAGDELLLRYNASSHLMELLDPAGAGAGAVLGPVTSLDNDFAVFSGTGGKLLKTVTLAAMRALLGLGTAALVNTGGSVASVGGALEVIAPVVAINAATPVIAGHRGQLLACSGTWTLPLTAAATLGNGFACQIYNVGTGVVTIDPNAAEAINGTATLPLGAGQSGTLYCDGANWRMTGVTASSGALTAFRITDATDIALGTCASGGTRVGSSFAATIPANGIIRISIPQAQFNFTLAANAAIGLGIDVNGTKYYVQANPQGTAVYAPGMCINNTPWITRGTVHSIAGLYMSALVVEFDIATLGCATGAQTCYVVMGHTAYPGATDAVTVKGTAVATRAIVEIIGV